MAFFDSKLCCTFASGTSSTRSLDWPGPIVQRNNTQEESQGAETTRRYESDTYCSGYVDGYRTVRSC